MPVASLQTCFISAAAGTPLTTLREVLESRGLVVLAPQDLRLGSDWAAETKHAMTRADLVIGVMTSRTHSQWVLFELGQAFALGKRILLITPPKSEPPPLPLHQLLVLRVDLENSEAMEFALDQVLAAPHRGNLSSTPKERPLSPLGQRADSLLLELERSLLIHDGRALEKIVENALRHAATEIVSPAQSPDQGADFAVWSDVLESFVGNPLLVEVKYELRDSAAIRSASTQLARQLERSNARWGLLLYGKGPDSNRSWRADIRPNVLAMSIREMIEALRTRSFPELVRDLRNRRVHGAE